MLNVYHGSDHVIEVPLHHGGKRTNDFGYGFHTAADVALAREWACSDNRDGFVNCYEADLDGLSVLDLTTPEYTLLNWLAILANYRTFWQQGSIAEEARAYLKQHFFIDPSPYDVVIGHRADDSSFSFARDFVSGTTSLARLSEAMRQGTPAEQIVFKSREAFSHLCFVGAESVSAALWYEKLVARDREALRLYRRTETAGTITSELFMIDIMREGIENGDPRLR